MPSDIDSCVESVLEDNPSYSESRAYAICWAQKNEGNLSAESPEALAEFATRNSLQPECANKVLDGRELDEDDPCWEGYTMVGMKTENGEEVPNCVPDDEVPDADLAADCPDGEMMINGECVPVEDVGSVPPSTLSAPVQFTLRQLETGPIEREELSANEVLYRNVKVLESGTWTDSGSGETIWYSPRGLENLEVRNNNSINIAHDDDNEVSEVGEMENARAEGGELYADLRIDTTNAAGEYADENLQATLQSEGSKGFGGPSVEIDAEGQEIEFNESRGLKELVAGKISGLGLVANPASKPVAFDRQVAERGAALSEGHNYYHLEEKAIDMDNMDMIRDTMAEAGVDVGELSDEELMDMAESLHGDLMDALHMAEHGDKDDEEEGEEEEMEMMDESDVVDLIQEEMDDLWGEIDELKEQMMGAEMAEELADADTVEEVESRLATVEDRTKELAEEPKNPRTMADTEESDSIFDESRRMSSMDATGSTSR